MGLNFSKTIFNANEYDDFARRLDQESLQLREDIQSGQFSSKADSMGVELEAWILDDKELKPLAVNDVFLDLVNHPLVVSELSKYNIELNTEPSRIDNSGFTSLERQLLHLWNNCQNQADKLHAKLLMSGSAPTLKENMFPLSKMSEGARYSTMNRQLLKAIGDDSFHVDVKGKDHLLLKSQTILPASAATSFQIHWKVPAQQAHHYYNISQVVSAAMVALSANTPYLFGKELWYESRIPFFEHAVCSTRQRGVSEDRRRAHFGRAYLKNCISEYFIGSSKNYPVLVPLQNQREISPKYHCTQFHNGTIWKWNRPVIGTPKAEKPHIRIEHRPSSSGPTIKDSIANTAFFIGLCHFLFKKFGDISQRIDFYAVEKNFYRAAKLGLQSPQGWLLGKQYETLQQLILVELLPMAHEGLSLLNLDSKYYIEYLDIVEQRTLSGQTGAQWQLDFIGNNGKDFRNMTEHYLSHQSTNLPVHTWAI